MKVLQDELVATTVPPESSEAYRLSLSCSLFYKVCKSVCCSEFPRIILTWTYVLGSNCPTISILHFLWDMDSPYVNHKSCPSRISVHKIQSSV